MPQQTIDGITWIYTTYSEGGTTYASIGDGTAAAMLDGTARQQKEPDYQVQLLFLLL